ncbi:Required for respiratory growth protein 9 mitochondrial [Actinomortierella wolfii]|nr:Required for respiratory growth protein 9 mitochondrial [Actinomortierella wolfii]
MQRAITLLRTRTNAAAVPACPGTCVRSFTSAHNVSTTVNPFSKPEVRKQAIARWGLDYKGPSALVYPQGRPEVSALAKETASMRIASGLYDRKKPKNDKGVVDPSHADQEDSDSVASARRRLDKDAPLWLKHKLAIREKLGGQAWQPHRRVSRQTMEQIRYLRKQFPDEWTVPKLSAHFKISVESVTRILRSKFTPSEDRSYEQDQKRQEIKNARIAESLEKMKTQRYLGWLRHEAANLSRTATQHKQPRSLSHIKLGAPKRE